PDLRDDEAPAADQGSPRPLAGASDRAHGSGGSLTMDRALARRLEARFEAFIHGPAKQRHDQTEIRIGAGDVQEVLTALHDEPDLKFTMLADLAGVDTGSEMQVVYHLWSSTTSDWLRVIVEGLSRDDPRIPSVTYLWQGAEGMGGETDHRFGIRFEGNR